MAFDSMDTTGASAGSIGRSVDPNAGNYGRGPMQNVPQTVKPPKTAKVKNARTGMKKQKKNLLFGS